MKTYRSRVWRPVLASALALAVIVGVFSFAPSRALARQLLAVFRVRQFAAIQVNPNQDQLEQIEQELIAKLFVSEPEILADEPEVQVANLEEAQALAGFAARKPSFAPGGDLRLDVKGRTTYALRFTGEGLRALLTMADMSPDLAPPDLTEAEVVVTMPAAVHLGNERFDVIQIYHPEVEYPEGINAQLIGEAALRIMGLKASEARRIAQSIDWTSTLVLPVPSSIATFQEVAVAGETGILLTPRDDVSGEQRALLWQKDGLVYVISGSMAGETLLQVAESMF